MPADSENIKEECQSNFDVHASLTLEQLAMLPHSRRTEIINKCLSLDSLADANGLLSQDIVDSFSRPSTIDAIAARYAPYNNPESCPLEELPLKTYHIDHLKTLENSKEPPGDKTKSVRDYDDWLMEIMSDSGLNRIVELAFVRTCERGIALGSQNDRKRSFHMLYEFYHPRVLKRRPKDPEWEDAVMKAWIEFDRRILASNSEIHAYPLQSWLRKVLVDIDRLAPIATAIDAVRDFVVNLDDMNTAKIEINRKLNDAFKAVGAVISDMPEIPDEKLLAWMQRKKADGRDRYAATGSLVSFLDKRAKERLPRLGYMMVSQSLEGMQDNGVSKEIIAAFTPYIGRIWETKEQCRSDLTRTFAEATLTPFKMKVLSCLEKHKLREKTVQRLNPQLFATLANVIPFSVAKANELIGTFWRSEKQCLRVIKADIRKAIHQDQIDLWIESLTRVSLTMHQFPDETDPPDKVNKDKREPDEVGNKNDEADSNYAHTLSCLYQALLENKLPDGEDLCEVLGDEVLEGILTSQIHWNKCRYYGRWTKRDMRWLDNIAKDRFSRYSIEAKQAGQIAQMDGITKAAVHYALFNSVRKIRCCIATELGDSFFSAARSTLERYLKRTREWQRDPSKYEARIQVENAEFNFKQKLFPLPSGGLLATALPRDAALKLCSMNPGIQKIAVDFHCNCSTVSDLSRKYKNLEAIASRPKSFGAVDQVNFVLMEHWLKIADSVELAFRLQNGGRK